MNSASAFSPYRSRHHLRQQVPLVHPGQGCLRHDDRILRNLQLDRDRLRRRVRQALGARERQPTTQ